MLTRQQRRLLKKIGKVGQVLVVGRVAKRVRQELIEMGLVMPVMEEPCATINEQSRLHYVNPTALTHDGLQLLARSIHDARRCAADCGYDWDTREVEVRS